MNEPFCMCQTMWKGSEISAFNFTVITLLFAEVPLGRNPKKTNKTLAVVQKTAVGGQCVCATTVCRSNTTQHVIMTSKANRPSGLGFMDVC